ncbi:exo-beta-1,3-glucanase [Panus rudis PR-1116 ss-1]|nr:exo-beta-1,3-glucanase [Panus rudis PR-1116 ss-1]
MVLSLGHLASAVALFAFGLLAQGAPADNPISPGFPYGSQKVRGVNLGGWLVLEPWITPSLFDGTGNPNIIDEWTFGQLQDRATATAKLTAHWNTWITESDFAAIAAAGLNHVRIPIGFWAFDVSGGEPYIQGQVPYLQKAVGWARNHGIKVIVDLHGAPGSQNGTDMNVLLGSFDNSGHKVPSPQWQTSQSNIDRTSAVIKTLASMFRDQSDVVTMIAPLNEPAGFIGDSMLTPLKQYWYDSYGNIRFPYGSSRQSNTVVLLHDAFQGLSYWNGFQTAPDFQGVAMDTHIYQMFSQDEVSRSNQQHIQSACSHASDLSSFDLWTVVGEWTPAMTDCAKYLNGRGVGARYDGSFPGSTRVGSCTGLTGKSSSFSSSYKTFLRQSWEAQTITYEKGAGWIQWLWKAEQADDWSYQAGLAGGWIPKNPTDRQYPNICN